MDNFRIILIITLTVNFAFGQDDDPVMFCTAKSVDGNSQIIAFAGNLTKDQITYEEWKGSSTQDLFQSIAYDSKKDWTAVFESTNRNIYVKKYLRRSPSTLTTERFYYSLPLSDKISGLAFATNFNLLYWVDATFKYIGAIDLIKGYWLCLVYSDLDKPYSIAVSEEKRFLFWSDIGSNAKIERSNLYGTERSVIVSSALDRPINLLVDKKTQRLFWLDGNLKCIDFDGNNIATFNVPVSSKNSLVSFVIYKDAVGFGTSSADLHYFKIAEDGVLTKIASYAIRNSTSIISQSLDSKGDITNIRNPCTDNSCDQICIPHDVSNSICLCQFGYLLATDGKSCTSDVLRMGYLLVGDLLQGIVYQADPITAESRVILNIFPNISNNFAYFLSSGESYIYYVTSNSKKVFRYNVFTKENSLFYETTTSFIKDIEVDQTTGKVYVALDAGSILLLNPSSAPTTILNSQGNIKKLYVQSGLLQYIECAAITYVVQFNLLNHQETKRLKLDFPCPTLAQLDLKYNVAFLGTEDKKLLVLDLPALTIRYKFVNIQDIAMDEDHVYALELPNKFLKVNKGTLKYESVIGNMLKTPFKILLMKPVTNGAPSSATYLKTFFIVLTWRKLMPISG